MKWLAIAAAGLAAAVSGWAQGGAAVPTPSGATPSSTLAPTPSSTRSPLRQTAEKKSAEWEILAKSLDAKIARMLPCDPRVKSAIEEVSRASEARMAALGEAMKAAVARAKADSGQAGRAEGEEARREAEAERDDTLKERAAIDAQVADLADSAKHRAALDEVYKKLAGIAAKVGQRATDAEEAVTLETTLNASLRELLVALQAREAALRKEQIALAAEASRWSEYYAARLARAQTECAITNPSAGVRRKQ